ncbi:MAG: DUF2786 domain-containing protein [Candidatus Nanopelagicales bacterium]|nr:DUF2786 domain-containing protein [Candidatus Nanopelagicales bacterium]
MSKHSMIKRLLAKAAATDSPAEAEALRVKAEELMIKHAISAAALAVAVESSNTPESIAVFKVKLTGDSIEEYAILCGAVVYGFGAADILRETTREGITMHFIGFPGDVMKAKLVGHALCQHAEFSMETAGLSTKAERRNFLLAYAHVIEERLRAREKRWGSIRSRASTDIALQRRSRAVREAVEAKYPGLGQRVGVPMDSTKRGHAQGTEAASSADIGDTRIGHDRLMLGLSGT